MPQAAAVKPQTWGQMFSSWFLPSPHPVHAQATNKTTPSSMKNHHVTSSLGSTGSSKSIKEPQAKPQAANFTKGNTSIVNPHSIPREDRKTDPSISTKGSKRGSQTLPNQAKDTDTCTIFLGSLPKFLVVFYDAYPYYSILSSFAEEERGTFSLRYAKWRPTNFFACVGKY